MTCAWHSTPYQCPYIPDTWTTVGYQLIQGPRDVEVAGRTENGAGGSRLVCAPVNSTRYQHITHVAPAGPTQRWLSDWPVHAVRRPHSASTKRRWSGVLILSLQFENLTGLSVHHHGRDFHPVIIKKTLTTVYLVLYKPKLYNSNNFKKLLNYNYETHALSHLNLSSTRFKYLT